MSSERLGPPPGMPSTSEDLHAWSIYRQNLNSDFTDSALGSSEKSPAPYGNFHLRDQTVQSILANPKYGPRSELGNNMYTYLKFGLPRVLAPRGGGSSGITKGKEAMKIFTACSVFPTVSILSKKIILKIYFIHSYLVSIYVTKCVSIFTCVCVCLYPFTCPILFIRIINEDIL